MTYEDKFRLMSQAKEETKDILLTKILKGETVDITKDADLFYQVNKDRMSMDKFLDRDKFKPVAESVARERQALDDVNHALTKSKKLRYLGSIPAEIYYSRPEFSANLSREERGRNWKAFLNKYPKFKAGSKTL